MEDIMTSNTDTQKKTLCMHARVHYRLQPAASQTERLCGKGYIVL